MTFVRAAGIVAQGHRVASGACGDPRFPHGTIAPQLPFFTAHLPDLEVYLGGPAHPATINLRFPGCAVTIRSPEHRLEHVAWTTSFAPESFYLSACELRIADAAYPAFLYIPDPRTKPDHQQAADVVELLCRFVPGLRYGMAVELCHASAAITIAPAR